MRDYLKSKLGVPEYWDKYDYQTQRYSFEDVEEILQTFKDEQLRIDDVSHRLLPELRAVAKKNRYISIEDFIRSRTTHWTQVDALRVAFEELLDENHNEEFSYERTSEIFITKGTKAGEIDLRYFPKQNGFLISHIVFRNGG